MDTCNGIDCNHEKCHSGPGIGGILLGLAEILVGVVMFVVYLFRDKK